MVKQIIRNKNDIFNIPILKFIFKNKNFLFILRVTIFLLFIWAIYLGFAYPTKENLFTPALFWGIFWSFFMVLTLPTLGRVFCGICPHGFIGKYITKIGLKKQMPKWMQNRFIGLILLVVGWWGIYYIFPGIYKTPIGTAIMFLVLTVLAVVFYFLYKDMSYCKYICPIGTVTRAYAKLSFTWLGSYKSACSECKTFDCASSCPYNLKPFTFNKKNSMEDCTLCMECANSCEAISFKFTKPSFSLFKRIKPIKAEVWAYILILASIPIAMTLHHGLGRSKIANEMIWVKTAEFFKPYLPNSIDINGLFAFLFALFFTIFFAIGGMQIASKILNKPFKETFYNLGYAFAPLFIFGSLAHALSSFFTRGYEKIIEGFAWGFGTSINVEPLAKRGDEFLTIFSIFKWIAVILALVILYKRFKLIDSSKLKKLLAYPFAAALIIFFLALNQYRAYIIKTYGRVEHSSHQMHNMHSGKLFQFVPFEKATILQKGKDANSCSVCGMKLHKFFKTNYVATTQSGEIKQFCSLHCLAKELKIKKVKLTNIRAVDANSLKFIDIKSAYFVVGSKKSATMSKVSKYAFSKKENAQNFAKLYGGKIVDFYSALKMALKDF